MFPDTPALTVFDLNSTAMQMAMQVFNTLCADENATYSPESFLALAASIREFLRDGTQFQHAAGLVPQTAN